MGVDSYKISLVIQKLTLILFPQLAELKPNKIIVVFNWHKTEMSIHSRARPTITSLLVYVNVEIICKHFNILIFYLQRNGSQYYYAHFGQNRVESGALRCTSCIATHSQYTHWKSSTHCRLGFGIVYREIYAYCRFKIF